ncbi:MAG: serine/threonine-protein kinase [Pirellulales bacterium]
MDVLLNDLEHEYRQQWVSYSPARCRQFLARVPDQQQASELLVRLLCIDLELCRTAERGSTMSHGDEDDRVKPNVALFMLQFPELRENPGGLERVVMLEYALRVQHDGERPNIDSYIELLPSTRLMKNLEEAQARLLELNYSVSDNPVESKEVEKSRSTVPQANIKDSFVAPSVPFTLGRFLLIRYIGRGGMGFVFAAIDLRSTAQVAIKMMRRGDGWSVFRFIEEFHWLSQLSHPNLVRLYDAYAEGDARYFSMEFVDGKDIRYWYRDIKSKFSDHLSTLIQSLAQLASAIHFLHMQGVIHRDIKCSNVMITPRGRTVLLDLGLAIRESDQNDFERPLEGDAMPGTFVYMSPEAYNNHRLSTASDWYSFGVTMFELLAGDVPRISVEKQDDSGKRRVFEYQPAQLRKQLGDLPAELAEMCIALLNPDPNFRPAGEHVLQLLGAEPEPAMLLGMNCFGRDGEIEQLNQAVNNCFRSNDQKALVTISGDAGMGKSHLLSAWLGSEVCRSFRLIHVKSHRQDHTPYRLWNQVVQELVRLWGHCPSQFETILKRRTEIIAQAFPQFLQLDSTIYVERHAHVDSSAMIFNSISKPCWRR